MSLDLVFNTNITVISSPFNVLYNSITYSQKYLKAGNVVDAYTYSPRYPVMTEDTNTAMKSELVKRPEYCLITVREEEDTYHFTLYSSNLPKILHTTKTFLECRIQDPTKELIESHNTGTLLSEQDAKDVTFEDKPFIVKLKDIIEEPNFFKSKSQITKLLPDQELPEFSTNKDINTFCLDLIKAKEA